MDSHDLATGCGWCRVEYTPASLGQTLVSRGIACGAAGSHDHPVVHRKSRNAILPLGLQKTKENAAEVVLQSTLFDVVLSER